MELRVNEFLLQNYEHVQSDKELLLCCCSQSLPRLEWVIAYVLMDFTSRLIVIHL